MRLVLERLARGETGDWITGRLGPYHTVERQSLAFPRGLYPVRVTPSGRVQAGTLWSPRPPYLPLILVPGRSGIRFHAGNHWLDVQGCVAVGMEAGVPGCIRASRPALRALMETLGMEEHELEVIESW